jgi:uncharacterized membrane protein YhaH (DUF805 family)
MWFLAALGFLPLFVTGCIMIANRRRDNGKPGGLARGLVWLFMGLSGMAMFVAAELQPPLQEFAVALAVLAFAVWFGAVLYVNHFSSRSTSID